ncbi:MAG: hypothetical protein R3E48_00165 [Burkholderiaceae bacterium]
MTQASASPAQHVARKGRASPSKPHPHGSIWWRVLLAIGAGGLVAWLLTRLGRPEN